VGQVVEEGRRSENSGKRLICALGIQGSEEAVPGRVQEGEIHSHCLRRLLLACLPGLRLVELAGAFAGGSRRHCGEWGVQHPSAVGARTWKAGEEAEGLFQRMVVVQAAFLTLPLLLVAWAPLSKGSSVDVQEHRSSKQAVQLVD